jgi:hypothetical protein
MKLKEYVRVVFDNRELDVYVRGEHQIHQPFNSDTGEKFTDQDEAMAWLLAYYPDLFTPS